MKLQKIDEDDDKTTHKQKNRIREWNGRGDREKEFSIEALTEIAGELKNGFISYEYVPWKDNKYRMESNNSAVVCSLCIRVFCM